ncbi:hypothetical protein [Polyangium jinanense]|uniref:Uncharacterized protein n=1 Tax=Polyangium jinanense TaxID=2829994 RepID=A0A9X3WZM6_9BACT|nr:hypothetical protein [Polyangium jinanense]MDC3953201.1 hypothetical protein [Polyangium jinanense]MDC3979678.1 hypothetical protein [Polyangium jinanense]
MTPPSASHRVVCLGVPGVPELGCEETNARDMFRLFSGALGPPGTIATCLVGEDATKTAVKRVFDAASRESAPFFVVYFSGRASEKGLHVADGCIGADTLARHFERVAAPSVLVVLDLVVGAVPDEDVVPAWVEAFARARKGLRVAAARATRIGAGSAGAGRGRFTGALLEALQTSEGDLEFQGAKYISDMRALDQSQAILQRRWHATHLPVRMGPFGEFPLARCQAVAGIGKGTIVGVAAGTRLSATVRYSIEGRAYVPTVLQYALEDTSQEVLGEGEVMVLPDGPVCVGRQRIRLPARVLADHTVWGPTLELGERVHVRWRISLRDARGRTLDRKVFGHEYAAPPKSSRRSRR